MEHRDNSSLDPTCKNAVFNQVGTRRKPKIQCVEKMCNNSDALFFLLQVYEGLKPSDKFEKTLDYRSAFYQPLVSNIYDFYNSRIKIWISSVPFWSFRWPARYDQWWECKFIAEGIIDQGGGFRDSLADMSEELCPSSSECPMPLPFFTRTSNQVVTIPLPPIIRMDITVVLKVSFPHLSGRLWG